MPTVHRLFLHPIKSLDPQEVHRANVLPSGALEHDRAYAIADAAGVYVNGKRHPSIHRLRSNLDLLSRQLLLRDDSNSGLGQQTFDLEADRPSLLAWLSSFFGFKVSLIENRDTGFPDDPESPGPTLIGTATLVEISRWFDLSLGETRTRFRTNIEIEEAPPFWEDRLFGNAEEAPLFSVGAASFRGINPCQRCNVPPRNPWTGANDPTFAKRFAEMRRATLPVWANSTRFNHFYRVAVNTRVADWRPGTTVRIGDKVIQHQGAG